MNMKHPPMPIVGDIIEQLQVPNKRKPISKGKRFDIFKRDHFTCQYCGAQPPSVVLVIDHIHPVSKGGSNDDDNLITSCEPCNQGKKAKVLSDVPIRPDAEFKYMELQQEIAEINRVTRSKAELTDAKLKFVREVQDMWRETSGAIWVPASSVVMSMLSKGSPESAYEAFEKTAVMVRGGSVGHSGCVAYAWGVFWKIEKGDQNG